MAENLYMIIGSTFGVTLCLATGVMYGVFLKLNRKYQKQEKLIQSYEETLQAIPNPLWVNREQDIALKNKAFDQTFSQLLASIQLTPESQGQEYPFNVQGSRHYYRLKHVPLDSGGELFYASNITEAHHQKNHLKTHIEAYKEVLQGLSAGVTIYNEEAQLVYFNQAYVRMFDFDEHFLTHNPTLGELLDNLRSRRMMSEYSNYQTYKQEQLDYIKGAVEPYEKLIHLPDNRTIRMIASPHPLGGCFFIFEDLTNALQLERKYNTQLAVQNASLDHLYEGVVVFGSDNRLRLYNKAFLRIWGLKESQLPIGEHLSNLAELVRHYFVSDVLWKDYKAKVIDRVTDRLPKNRKIKRQDGTVLEFAYIPLPDGSNLMSYTDVSDSAALEELLRERNNTLERANRIKSSFIANVSYEFRTPLNTIIGFTEMLLKQIYGDLNDQQKSSCHHILQSSQRLLDLVNDILDLAMIQAGYMELEQKEVQLQACLGDVLREMQPQFEEKGINLVQDVECADAWIKGDQKRLHQALRHIFVNGLTLNTTGDTIKVKIKQTLRTNQIVIEDTSSGHAIGDQIDQMENYRDTVNQNGQQKLGIGLSLVQGIMEMHKGRLKFASKAGAGTKVVISFARIEYPKEISQEDNEAAA
jgi:signal transduction histidine kinase